MAKTVAIPKIAAFAATVKTAMGPIGWLSMGLTALASVGGVVATTVARQNEAFNGLTATSKRQYEEVRRLNREHERAIELYGRNSDAARALAGQVDGARLAFENNRRTIAEVRAEQERLLDANRRAVDSHRNTLDAISADSRSADALINRLGALTSQASLTAGEQREVELIVNRLNSQFPELSLSVDRYTRALSRSAGAMREWNRAEEERRAREEKFDASRKAEQRNYELRPQIEQAERDAYNARRRAMEHANSDAASVRAFASRLTMGLISPVAGAAKERQEANAALAGLREEYEKNLAIMANYADAMEKYSARAAEAKAEAATAYVLHGDAIKRAVSGVAGELMSLVERYNEAHAAAQGVLDIFSLELPGYATGTTNAPNAFIAGEQEPELIVGAGGSAVYSAGETRHVQRRGKAVRADAQGQAETQRRVRPRSRPGPRGQPRAGAHPHGGAGRQSLEYRAQASRRRRAQIRNTRAQS